MTGVSERIAEIRIRNAEREKRYCEKTAFDRARIFCDVNEENEVYLGKAVERYNLFPPRHSNLQDRSGHQPKLFFFSQSQLFTIMDHS